MNKYICFFNKNISYIAFCVYGFVVALAAVVLPVWVAIIVLIPLFIPLFGGDLFCFKPPARMMRYLFSAYLLANSLWPKYLAIQLPGPDINPQRLVLLILVSVFFVSFLSPQVRGDVFEKISSERMVFALFFGLVCIRFFASLLGLNPIASLGPFFSELVEVFIVFLIAYFCFENYGQIRKVVFVLLLCGVMVSILAICEFLLKKNLFATMSMPGMALDPDYIRQALSDKTRHGVYRAQASFFHPLLLTEYCVYQIPVAFYFLSSKSFYERLIGVIGVLVVPLAAAASGSRSSIVATVFVFALCVLFIFLRLRYSKKYGAISWLFFIAAICLSITAIFVLFDYGVFDSVFYGKSLREQQSTAARIYMYQKGIPAIFSSPLIGYGLGLAAEIVGFSANGSFSIDSFFLSYVIESGVPGLLVLIGVVTFPFARVLISKVGEFSSGDVLLVSYLAIGVAGLFLVKTVLSLNGNTYLLFLSAALVLRLTGHKNMPRLKAV